MRQLIKNRIHIYNVSLHTHTRHLTVLALINHEANQKCPIIIMQALWKASWFFSLFLLKNTKPAAKSFCNGLHFQEMVLVRGTVQGYYLHLP